ncbi:MAG: ATP-binding protein [Rhodothermales bacterium]
MTTQAQDFAAAVPTKQFFVSMLTRDINLADAILDLVDNCLDGALRMADGNDVDYSKHLVEIELDADHFLIADNCGGIPRHVAKNYAFKMGRDRDDDRDAEEETIGMYGVGMKRAIFKMGREALVRTRHGDDTFEVPITSEWLDEKEWTSLPINDTERQDLEEPGTIIRIDELYPGVSRHFSNAAWQNELRTSIAEHFTVFLQEGLKITVNGAAIAPVLVEVLVSREEEGPAPYVFQKTIDDVLVSIVVGLNTGRGLPGDEDDMPEFERDRSAATAGWAVFCNDRAVIVGDKSRLTGWGDGLPLYHYQFSIITGIVEFRSKSAEKLPVTTTKRALDTSSDVWLQALVKMKEGMRMWTTYTNKWKNHPRSDQSTYWEDAVSLPLENVIAAVSDRPGIKKNGRLEYNPQKLKVIPEPPHRKPSSRRVVFSRPIEEVRTVSKALFDTFDEKPGVVGDKCFSLVLSEIMEEG